MISRFVLICTNWHWATYPGHPYNSDCAWNFLTNPWNLPILMIRRNALYASKSTAVLLRSRQFARPQSREQMPHEMTSNEIFINCHSCHGDQNPVQRVHMVVIWYFTDGCLRIFLSVGVSVSIYLSFFHVDFRIAGLCTGSTPDTLYPLLEFFNNFKLYSPVLIIRKEKLICFKKHNSPFVAKTIRTTSITQANAAWNHSRWMIHKLPFLSRKTNSSSIVTYRVRICIFLMGV